MDFLAHLFAWVCGQNPAHTWSPGGWLLPCCQRCTGLYVGACIGAALHFWLKPRLSGRFLEVHGAFLLLMMPFGFHWLAQSAWVRTATGVLFGFGVVTFLWLLPDARVLSARPTSWHSERNQRATLAYVIGLMLTTIAVPALAQSVNAQVALLLAGLTLAGLLALTALVVANVVFGMLGCVRFLRWLRTRVCA